MPGCVFKPINRGRLYALDEQVKLQWPGPAAIEDQFLLVDQPARLPLLSFASQVYQQKPNGQGVQKMRILCIDKRNGRTAYKAEFVNNAGLLDITGDAEKKTVDMVMQRNTIRLTFTDKPIPPASEAGQQPAKPPQERNAARALWDSIQKMLGRSMDEYRLETEEEERINRRGDEATLCWCGGTAAPKQKVAVQLPPQQRRLGNSRGQQPRREILQVALSSGLLAPGCSLTTTCSKPLHYELLFSPSRPCGRPSRAGGPQRRRGSGGGAGIGMAGRPPIPPRTLDRR